MIIQLKLKNWMSFRDEMIFSPAGTGERRFQKRVPRIRRNPALSVVPVSVLYGGNASGKTNFFLFFSFLKQFIVSPIHDEEREIPVVPFQLDAKSAVSPTEICLTFLASDDEIYSYHLSLTRFAILSESLARVNSKGEESVIFTRKDNQVSLEGEIAKDKDARAYQQILEPRQAYLAIAGKKTPQLQSAYFWFRKQLTLIYPQTHFGNFRAMFEAYTSDKEHLASLLQQLDTGICKLELEDIPFSSSPFNEQDLNKFIKDDKATEIIFDLSGERYIVKKENGQSRIQKLVSFHQGENGEKVRFQLTQESDGSLRLLDIIPAFLDLEQENARKIYIIDELDRSWHYLLTRRLLGIFLSRCSEASRSQLVFSTHDLMLMDQDLFRRDEMWIAERNQDGCSQLYPLASTGVRYDKDLRKLYLQGKLGGIPHLNVFGNFNLSDASDANTNAVND